MATILNNEKLTYNPSAMITELYLKNGNWWLWLCGCL